MTTHSRLPELVVVHEHPLTFLGELALDLVHSLSVPDRYGPWDCHRWDGAR